MDQDRNRSRNDDDMPNRSSNMEQAEGSRRSHEESDKMRNRTEDDLGTSSDRAMFEDPDSAEERESLRGSVSGPQRQGSTDQGSRSDTGGITNRPLDLEQHEQEQLPPRGRSQSDSER